MRSATSAASRHTEHHFNMPAVGRVDIQRYKRQRRGRKRGILLGYSRPDRSSVNIARVFCHHAAPVSAKLTFPEFCANNKRGIFSRFIIAAAAAHYYDAFSLRRRFARQQ